MSDTHGSTVVYEQYDDEEVDNSQGGAGMSAERIGFLDVLGMRGMMCTHANVCNVDHSRGDAGMSTGRNVL